LPAPSIPIFLSSIQKTLIITKIRTMSLVYLILGGNQGDRDEIISEAIDLVTNKIGHKIVCSSRYETESWGFKSEPFLNQVIVLETILTPEATLAQCLQIENQLGRARKTDRYVARTIDIDLLYFDSLVINSASLTLPHPRIAQRKFVLVPLSEIAPELRDPVTGATVLELLDNCIDSSLVRRIT